MRIISRLKHATQIATPNGIITIPPSGEVTDCRTVETHLLTTDEGVSVVRQVYGEINNLPPRTEGVLWLVSTITAQAAVAMGRDDFISPNSGPTAVRFTKDDAPNQALVGQIRHVKTCQTF